MKVLDLFSGIGGFSYGLERAGFKTIAFCEIDKSCHLVLRKHWPQLPIYDDVNRLNGYELEKQYGGIDVICGGFPCTDISVAGKKKGLIDENGERTRSGLWFEYKRLIGEIRPRYVIIENVANLRGNGLVSVLQDLWTLGYNAEWNIISARDIGSVHLRERIWIVAYPCSERRQQEPGGPRCNEKKNERRRKKNDNESKRNGKGDSSKQILGEMADVANSDGEGLERSNESGGGGGTNRKKTLSDSGPISVRGPIDLSNSDNFRLWKPFTSSQEKSQWWTETTACFRDRWKVEPDICRVANGIPDELDTPERVRKERIKQLGNSIVPQIAEFIGTRIKEYESCH